MNERIKELSGQAWLYARAIYGDYLTDSGKANHDFFDTFDKKFAELIVEEVYDYILNATMYDEPFPFREDVKKHFGVEE